MPSVQSVLVALRLKKGCEQAIRQGMPWIYAGDIIVSSELLFLSAGSLVRIEDYKGQFVGIGYYNGASQIMCRVLTFYDEPIDAAFFKKRLEKALHMRDALIGVPYYRWVHSEADGLPGLLIDRFGDVLSIQVGTAGMHALQVLWLDVVECLIAPKTIVLRNDVSVRSLEGLSTETIVLKGSVPALVEVYENECVYFADILKGQKTGWFYDQRDNRRMIAMQAKDHKLLDVYSHSGGFGVQAALHGAQVTMVDSSRLALDLAQRASERNEVMSLCQFIQGDAFDVMTQLQKDAIDYDIVLADPPAFIKRRSMIASGLKGYEKVARMAASLVRPNGLLFIASCSHYAGRSAFQQAVEQGIRKAGRTSAVLKHTGAAGDHPLHPRLPQSEYLKGLLLRIA